MSVPSLRKPLQAVPTGAERERALAEQLQALSAEAQVRILRSLHHDLLRKALPVVEEAATAGDDDNKRRQQRQRTLRPAKIIYHNRTCVSDCQIRDISATGARIRVASTSHLPNHFELVVAGAPQPHQCEVRWRSPIEMGLKFIA